MTKGRPSDLPVPAKRTASGSIKGPTSAGEQHIEEASLSPGSPMKLSSPAKSTKTRDIIMTEEPTEANQPLPGKTPAKSRIPVKPLVSPSPAKLARTISRFSSTTDGESLYYCQYM